MKNARTDLPENKKKIKLHLAAEPSRSSKEDRAAPYCLLEWQLQGQGGEIKAFRTVLIRFHLKSQREIKIVLA